MLDQNFLFDNKVFTKLFVATVKESPYFGPYLYYLMDRARIKYNFQGVIGEQGSGKSYYTIIEALITDPTFNKDRIVYSTINFLDGLDMLEDRILKGRRIMWDDAGVGLPSDEWYALSNRIVKRVQQTVRTLHPTITFTMPDLKYLDPGQRRVLTCIIDCNRAVENRTDLRIYTLKRIRIMDKSYHRRFTFSIGLVKMKYGSIKITHLPEDMFPDIIKDYEMIQRKFKFETRKKLRKLVEGMVEKKLRTENIDDYSTVTLSDMEKKLVHDIYKMVFANVKTYLNRSKKIDIEKLQREFKINRNIARTVKQYWDKKFTPDLVKEDLDLRNITSN